MRQPGIETKKITLPNEKERESSQNYIMFINESPLNDKFDYEKVKSYFNWTMTYRKDSDFYQPYGWVAPKNWTWHYPDDSAKQDWSRYPISTTTSCYIYFSSKSKKPT